MTNIGTKPASRSGAQNVSFCQVPTFARWADPGSLTSKGGREPTGSLREADLE